MSFILKKKFIQDKYTEQNKKDTNQSISKILLS